ncbi:MAG: glycoside hydrolase family 3 C-terminal domain-containing protein, partial [Alistipes sp.]|nr:glycoside hydrolase family 3 C-terminal domain-containing protein [Alistipes sp.]
MKRFFLTLSAVLLGLTVSAQMLPYQNPALSNEERARDLVSRMTLEEKVSQMQNGAAPIDRLGIPFYDWWSEALHGIARAGLATVFPQTIGMASSFDEQLIEQVFTATSDEARAKYIKFIKEGSRKRYQGLSVWTPNINIFRDPRWGRGQETYGEDPYLTTQLGLAVVRGLQGDPNAKFNKLHACAKHYAVHSGPEWNRHSFDAKNISKRDLRETYLPAFEALVREGNVKEVMGAYNRFEGDPCNASNYLLEEILRKEWGYKGIVVSDCGAIRDFYMKGHHETHADAAEASAAAVKAGCDLECGSSYAALVEAVKRGLITEKEIDRAVERLMVAKFEMGLFEKVDPYSHIPYSVVDCPEHRALAKEMAIKSFVLLQNRDDLLPLDKAKKVAIVGPNADNEEMQWANYNGIPSYTITLKEGLEALLPK